MNIELKIIAVDYSPKRAAIKYEGKTIVITKGYGYDMYKNTNEYLPLEKAVYFTANDDTAEYQVMDIRREFVKVIAQRATGIFTTILGISTGPNDPMSHTAKIEVVRYY